MRKVLFDAVPVVLGIALLLALPAFAKTTGCDMSVCVTSHDTIPNFAGHPTMSSVRRGAWSDPGTWSTGRVPDALDIVQITSGTTVTYDLADGYARVVGIQANATLMFRADVNTRLTVGTVLVLPQGVFDIRTADARFTTEIVMADQALDALDDGKGTFDPRQYGTGLLAVDGEVLIHGATKSPYVRLAVEPKAGDTSLQLEAPVHGWQPGDRLFLPDSKAFVYDNDAPYKYEGEEMLLASLSPSGTVATLQNPLRFNHPGARNGDGTLEFLPHVGNLSRNVVVRSEHPAGTRGHVLLVEASDVDIRYVQFQNLGRTTIDQIDNTTFDDKGNVTHLGTNHAGRYPLHIHHVMGPTPIPTNGYQFTLLGNVVTDDTRNHRYKWALTIHDSHYGLIQDNVVYNAAGWGIGTEEGNESFNVFSHNFVVQVRGTGARDKGETGAGFWLRGPNNYVRDNVAANTMGVEGASTGGYGYALYFSNLTNIHVPNFQGADTSASGQYTVVDGNATPLLEFARNELYGATETGLTIWDLGAYGTRALPVAESTIKDFRTWHYGRFGYYGYPTNHVTIDGFVARGKQTVLSNRHAGPVGMTFGDYMTQDVLIRKADIQNFRAGIVAPYFMRNRATIENSYLRNANNIVILTIGAPGSAPYGPGLPPKETVIRNVRFAAVNGPVNPPEQYNIYMGYTLHSGSANLIQHDTVLVYDYNQVPRDDFQVFYYEQRPDFIVPQSSGNLAGSPEVGLTNTQNWAKYGIAIAGEVATNVVTHPSIFGYVRNGTSPQEPAPIVPPSISVHPASQTIPVGQSATFSVTATGTSPLSYQWQKNGTSIAGATAAGYTTPPVQQADNGVKFRCVVSNDAGTVVSNAATLTVTAPEPATNQAPRVDAGNCKTVLINTRVQLHGTVTDDGLPTPPGKVTVTWSKVTGPGSVMFTTPSSVDTTVLFSRVGTYTLQLKATDSALTSTARVQITVQRR